MKTITVKMKLVEGLPVLQPVGEVAAAVAALMRVEAFDLERMRRIQQLGFRIELLPSFCSVN